ncbi:MAG: transglycosylase SLT domain-containing protein [Acidobacteria bacterium]|nr:transglycosylase SLT domain-containing protein [Acidobacteriota bacterium]
MKNLHERTRRLPVPFSALAALLFLLTALSASAAYIGYCGNATGPCSADNPKSPCYAPPEPDPKCEPCDKCTMSPCYAATGVYVSDVVDLQIGTPGFPLEATRHYQSNRAIDGDLGFGWVSSLSAHLSYTVYLAGAPSTVLKEADVRVPEGSLYRFKENGDGSFTPPNGRFDRLVHNGDGSFDLTLQRTRSVLHFDATGKLLSMVDDYGNTLAYTYSGDRLQRVQDMSGSGRFLDVTWGGDGRISDVTDFTGRSVHYDYDARGVLTGATNPLGQKTTYDYVANRWAPLLSSVTDPWGRNVTTITYDPQSRTHSYTEDGETWTYLYTYNGNAAVTAKSDSAGHLWKFTYTDGGLVTDRLAPGATVASHATYDANGLIVAKIDEVGKKTTYAYAGNGSISSVILDDGGPSSIEYRYVYDTQFPEKVVSITPYRPRTTQIDQKWVGWRTEYYAPGSPAPGAVYRESRLNGDGTTSLLATYVYDTHGRVTSMTDAAGAVTDSAYDGAGNLLSTTLPSNNDAGTRPVVTYAYDTLGRQTSETDALGKTVTYTYDALNRTTSVTLPKPSSSSTLVFTTSCVYDQLEPSFPNLIFNRVTDPNGRVTRSGVDAFGQLAAFIDAAGNATLYGYDKGIPVALNDANGNITTFTFDAQGRQTATHFPDGQSETYVFNPDDTLYRKTDRKGQSVTFTYDGLKRITTETYSTGGSLNYLYDGKQLVQVNDLTVSPGEVHTFTYDAKFQVATNTEATRGTLTYTHDAAGRVSTVSLSGGPTSTYGYYTDSSPRTIQWSPLSGSFQYTYRPNGQMESITFPNGQSRQFGYDEQARLTLVDNVHPTAGHLATFAYGYDVDNATGLPTMLGERTRITATIPSQGLSAADTRFYYDALYRLTRADYPVAGALNGDTHSWTYDAIGNRLTATVNTTTRTYTYQSAGTNPNAWQRMSSDGLSAYAYDANGNTTTQTGYTFTWDRENRMTGVSGAATASYRYDYAGRRTTRTSGGTTTESIYADVNLLRDTGATVTDYLYGIGIDEPLAMFRGGTVSFFDVDALGSIVAVNATDGTVVDDYQYDAWGVTRLATETIPQPFRFTAREAGDVPGQYYFRARFLASDNGRFLSEDPLGVSSPVSNPASLWSYTYSEDMPVMYIDPFGLKKCPCDVLKKLIHANNTCKALSDNTVLCVVLEESQGDPTKVSAKKARGLMQIRASAAKQQHCAKDYAFNPASNINCGTSYLCYLYDHHGNHDVTTTIGLYNTRPQGPPIKHYSDAVNKCINCVTAGGDCKQCNPWK